MSNTAPAVAIPYAPPTLAGPERLDRAAAALWRVVGAEGRPIGHLRIVEDQRGLRYRAERFHAASGTMLEVGEFWSPGDAVEVLRSSR